MCFCKINSTYLSDILRLILHRMIYSLVWYILTKGRGKQSFLTTASRVTVTLTCLNLARRFDHSPLSSQRSHISILDRLKENVSQPPCCFGVFALKTSYESAILFHFQQRIRHNIQNFHRHIVSGLHALRPTTLSRHHSVYDQNIVGESPFESGSL